MRALFLQKNPDLNNRSSRTRSVSWQYPLINYFLEASENEKCSKTGAVCTTPEISKFVFTHKTKEGGQNDPERLNYNDTFGNMGCQVSKGDILN